jgi:hypothetical protein
MKHLFTGALACAVMFTSCTFDLTEVQPERRNPRFVTVLQTVRGGDTQVVVHLDAGTTDQGTPRSLEHDHISVNGVPRIPTERLASGILVYEIGGIPEGSTPITIVPPQIEGVEMIPAVVVAPLGIAVADTITPTAGVLEIPVVDSADNVEWSHANWNAVLYAEGLAGPLTSVMGMHPLPAILRVPTVHLSSDIRAGHVEVLVVSHFLSEPSAVVQIGIQRTMRASIPFRIPE